LSPTCNSLISSSVSVMIGTPAAEMLEQRGDIRLIATDAI
jgi:hypothetical protein